MTCVCQYCRKLPATRGYENTYIQIVKLAKWSNPIVIVILAATILWIAWRIWTFTIKPLLNPKEPREMPYSIPFVGHAIAFFKNGDQLFTRSRKYFGNTRAPFAITIAGQRIYVITSPQDTNLIYRNNTTLSFDEFVGEILKDLGVSLDGQKKAWGSKDGSVFSDDPSFKHLSSWSFDLYHRQFDLGDEFTKFWTRIETEMSNFMVWDRIPTSSVTKDGKSTKEIDLWKYTRECLVESVTRAFWGNALFEIEPQIVKIYHEFDDNSWKILYKFPDFAAKDTRRALASLKAVLKKYINLPKSQRSDASWVAGALEDKMREYEVSDDDIATMLVTPLWVINANAYKLSFWLLCFILSSPSLYTSILNETKPILSNQTSTSNLSLAQIIEQKSPLLLSSYHEVLRLVTSSASVRGIKTNTNLGPNITLKAGNKLLIPYRQLHMNESSWGNDSEIFNSERFLKAKNLEKSTSFRPFGGGFTYCAGRFVAMREVISFVALALNRFDMRVVGRGLEDGDAVMRLVDKAMPNLGVLPPLKGTRVEVEVGRK